jgi:hypothetical protein
VWDEAAKQPDAHVCDMSGLEAILKEFVEHGLPDSPGKWLQ